MADEPSGAPQEEHGVHEQFCVVRGTTKSPGLSRKCEPCQARLVVYLQGRDAEARVDAFFGQHWGIISETPPNQKLERINMLSCTLTMAFIHALEPSPNA